MKKQLKIQGSRKLECPAQIQVRDAMVFEDYGVDAMSCDTENSLQSAKEKVAKKLKKDLQDGVQGKTTVHHYIRIPLSSLHKRHPIGVSAGVNQKIDKRIIDKIFELISKGVTNISEVKHSIADFVEKELFRGVPVDK